MQLPFSRDAFFEVFASYNQAWWPVALALWLATGVAFVARISGRDRVEWTFALLAVQWAWSGIVYHAGQFSLINPAAWIFAALFILQAGLIAWYGVVQHRLHFASGDSIADVFGYVLVGYALLYPALSLLSGHSYPQVPTFGVPCPTTIATVGFLMLVRERMPPLLVIVPLLWAVVGGSAAFLLGVGADLALFVSAFVLMGRMWLTRSMTIA